MKSCATHSTLLGLVVFCLTVSQLLAQSGTPKKLAFQAKAYYDAPNAVMLVRWVPMDYLSWKTCMDDGGYLVERFTISIDGEPLSSEAVLESKVTLFEEVKPASQIQWEDWANSDELAGVVAGCIYGDSLEVIDLAHTDMMSIYNINQERDNRFGFSMFACDQNFAIAELAGLACRDESIDEGYEYLYLISPMYLEESEDLTIEKGAAIVKVETPEAPPQPRNIRTVPGDRIATIVWDREDIGGETPYTSYVIERSIGDPEHWEPLNTRPFVSLVQDGNGSEPITFLDSLPDNDHPVFYRVKGKTPFGIYGPESDTVETQGVPALLVHAPTIDSVVEVTASSLRVYWKMLPSETSQVSRYEIFRCSSIEGPFVKIDSVNSSTMQYTDASPLPSNYYIVKAKDLNGNRATSFPALGQLNDTVPPAMPTGLVSSCDRDGLIKLHWHPNTEPDLYGYRVYTSNEGIVDTEFIQITPAVNIDTIFLYQISLNTLTEDIFFGIRAVDKRENESPMSSFCTVKRPDIIPPSAPVISAVRPRPDAVEIDWIPSSSPDVVWYVVQKRQEQAVDWTTLFYFTKNNVVLSVTDSLSYVSPASRRVWYQYRVMACDEASLMTSSKILRAKPVETGLRTPVQNLAAVGVPSTGTTSRIILTWEYDKDVDLVGFQIFRAVDTSLTRPFKFVAVADVSYQQSSTTHSCQFLDYDIDFQAFPVRTTYLQPPAGFLSNITTTVSVQPGALNQPIGSSPPELHYQVAAIFADGAQSPLSGVVSVQVH